MKILKKSLAVLLAIVFVLSMAACHPKDEVAISVGEYELTSAVYSYYLVMADQAAKSIISSDTKTYNTSDPNFDLYKQTIEGKSYVDYVKAAALEECKYFLTLAKLAGDAKVSLAADEAEYSDAYAEFEWEYYGYGPILEENGVSLATYKNIKRTEALYTKYFQHLYDEGGVKAVDKETIKKTLNDNYQAVYMITHSYSDVKEPNTEEIAKSLDKYVQALKDGKKFADVQAEYKKDEEAKKDTTSSSSTSSNNSSSGTSSTTSSGASSTTSSNASSTTTSTTTSSTTSSSTEEEVEKPADSNVTVITKNEDTSATHPADGAQLATVFAKYDDVAKLKADEIAFIHDEDAKAYYIVVKKDINADEYYLKNLNLEILDLLKGEEYDNMLKDTIAKTEFNISNFAINQFKVKKIYVGE